MFGLVTGLVSGLIALTIPFQMNKIKKLEKEEDTNRIIERINKFIKVFISYNGNFKEEQSSVFSGIDFIKHNKKLLYKLNISLRANSTKGVPGTNPPIPPREIYDFIIHDRLAIRITINATLEGRNFYKINRIDFYDYKENQAIERSRASEILSEILGER